MAVLAVLSIVVLITLAVFVRIAVQRQLSAFLAQRGVGQSMIVSNGDFSGGSILLSDIKLDPAGDSTIGDVRARIRWPFILSSRPFSQVVIDHLNLAGTVDEDGHMTISGFKINPLAPLVEADEILLDSGKLELATPAGDLEFFLKGRAVRQPDGSFKLDAAFWGTQFQMTLDTRWQGTIGDDGKWTAAADVREMRGNMSHIMWSRGNGWLKVDGDRTGILSLSGQIQAGQMRIGTKTMLSNLQLTMDGPLATWHTILSSTVAATQGMTMTLETRDYQSRRTLHVDVAAQSAGALVTFLTDLRDDLRLAAPRSGLLTTLLLTPGNLNRIDAETKKQPYRSADLRIDGEATGLQSKIVLHGAQDTAIDVQPNH